MTKIQHVRVHGAPFDIMVDYWPDVDGKWHGGIAGAAKYFESVADSAGAAIGEVFKQWTSTPGEILPI